MRTKPHIHDTDSPRAACCWEARRAELDKLMAADAARRAKYGATSCGKCGRVYRVTDGVVEDHEAVCQPTTDAQFWA